MTSDDIFTALDPIPEAHRNNYRGRNLGESTEMSIEHMQAIMDGSFKNLWVGDYWTHGGVNYRIADVEYFWNCGFTKVFTSHHLVIVPDTSLYNARMNETDMLEGGYIGSEMYTKNLEQAKSMINEAFPGMILTHEDFLVNDVADCRPNNRIWTDSTVELMNENMVFGSHNYSQMPTGNQKVDNRTLGKYQYALFSLNPRSINIRVTYWLRDIGSSGFAYAGVNGNTGGLSAENNAGVRPYFCIGYTGENLLKGTKDFSGDRDKYSWIPDKSQTYNGFTVYKANVKTIGLYNSTRIQAKAGETYTFSFYAKADKEVGNIKVYETMLGTNTNPGEFNITIGTEWKRYNCIFKMNIDAELTCRVEIGNDPGTTVYVCGYKVELGPNPNPVWSANPND